MDQNGATTTLAPEQTLTYPRLSHELQNEKTNVFQLGCLMTMIISSRPLDVMLENHEAKVYDTIRRSKPDDGEEGKRLNGLFSVPALRRHFSLLLPAVKSCLRFHQKDRPTLDDLLVRVEEISEDIGNERIPRDGRQHFKTFLEATDKSIWRPQTRINDNAEPINWEGKPIDHRGNRVNERGQRINDLYQPIDDNRRLINARGRAIDDRHPPRYLDERNRITNRKGERINERLQLVDRYGDSIDVFGRPIDRDGKLTNNRGDRVDKFCWRINEKEELIGSQGNSIDQEGNLIHGPDEPPEECEHEERADTEQMDVDQMDNRHTIGDGNAGTEIQLDIDSEEERVVKE
jgi:hypothetical protein